jgi:DNA-binding transcriptional LysR family regulator
MDKLANIIAFIAVGETNSFAEAARRLRLANSVVSKRVKDLEAHLGTRLLQRSTRHVRLTDAGYTYFDHARRLVGELAEVEDNLRTRNENPVGEIAVAAPVSFGIRYLGPALAGYLEKYPGVSLRLSLGERREEALDEGFDLVIRIGDVQHMSAMARKLAESRRVVVASPAYLDKHGRPKKPQDLLRHNCLIYSGVNDGRSWPFLQRGRKHRQPVSGRFASDNGMLLAEAAAEGCGVTMLPTFIVGGMINDGRLEIVLEDAEEEPLAIQAVYRQQRHISARLRKLIDHLAGHFSAFSA